MSKIGQAGNYNKNGGINFDLLPKRVWLGERFDKGRVRKCCDLANSDFSAPRHSRSRKCIGLGDWRKIAGSVRKFLSKVRKEGKYKIRYHRHSRQMFKVKWSNLGLFTITTKTTSVLKSDTVLKNIRKSAAYPSARGNFGQFYLLGQNVFSMAFTRRFLDRVLFLKMFPWTYFDQAY